MDQTLGKRIMENRKRLNLTQDKLAEKLDVSSAAVSKWERNVALPDITLLPELANILDISIEELITVKPQKTNNHKKIDFFIDLILKTIPLAMGVAVVVIAVLDELPVQSGFIMLGLALFCTSMFLLRNKNYKSFINFNQQ